MKLKKLLLVSSLAFAMPVSLISLSIASSIGRKEPVRASAAPGANEVSVNGQSLGSHDGDYMLNNGSVGTSENYNYRYDSSTGILTLNNFNGNKIRCSSESSPLVINALGTNYIGGTYGTSNQYMVYAYGGLTIGGTGVINLEASRQNQDTGRMYGLWVGNDHPIQIEDSVSVNIEMHEAKSPITVIRAGYNFSITDSASLDLACTTRVDETSDAIYCHQGSVTFDTSSDVRILLGSVGDLDHAIYNYASNYSATDNGYIIFAGSGKVEITNTGSEYAEAITNSPAATNRDGTIIFDGSDVSIQSFAYAAWSRSLHRSTDSYDIILRNGAKVDVTSRYEEFGHGLVSLENGISIDDSSYTYRGIGYPLSTAGSYGNANESLVGIDVTGESKVDIVVEQYGKIEATINQVNHINLTGTGYFDYKDEYGQFPSYIGEGKFYVNLGTNTRFANSALARVTATNGTEPDVGSLYQAWSSGVYGSFRLETYVLPLASDITVKVNNDVELTEAKPYFHNGEDTPSDIATDFNAYYNFSEGTLYLNEYNGNAISFDNASADGVLFKIVLLTDSTINAYNQGIKVTGSYATNLEITTEKTNPHSLIMNIENDSSNVYGIYSSVGNIRFTGYSELYLNCTSSDTTETSHEIMGIYATYANAYIKFDGQTNAYIHLNGKIAGGTTTCAYTGGRIDIDSGSGRFQFDAGSFESGNSITLHAMNNVHFIKYGEIDLLWVGEGSQSGPTHFTSEMTAIENGAVNISEASHYANVIYGDKRHIDVLNGYADKYQGNYVQFNTAFLTADTISGLNFVRWEHTGNGVFTNDSQTNKNATFTVVDNETVEATYDFVEKAPFFDNRKEFNNGYLKYKLKGTPEVVAVVDEAKENVILANVNTYTTYSTLSELPEGNYRLRAKYGTHYLYSDLFNVDPAADPHEYELRFQAGEGSGEDFVVVRSGSYELPTLSDVGFTAPEGYRLKAWSCDGEYAPGAIWSISDDYVFTAVYELIPTYTLSFAGGTGYVSGTMDAQEKLEGQNFVLPTPTFEHEAHMTFDYWDIGGVHYEASDTIEATGNLVATAYYKYLPTHTLTLTCDEHATGEMSSIVKYEDEMFVLPTPTFTPNENMEFSHWLVGGVEYAAGAQIAATADKSAVAVYTNVKVTITFFPGEGGSGSMDPVIINKGSEYTLPTCSFTAQEGKEFDGWMVDGVKHDVGDKIVVNENTSITATWKDAPVTPSDPVAPAKSGLSGGAIAAIVIASVLVAGVGGFSLVWFVFLKKSWADFVAIFKKK